MVIKLKDLRVKFGFTQKKLAEIMGKTQQTIARWESGKAEPSIADMKDLAILLGTSLDMLLGHEPIVQSSIPHDFVQSNITGVDGFWGHLGIKLHNAHNSVWYPISSHTYQSLYTQFQSKGWCYTHTLNNKVLVMNKNNIERFCLLDDACDALGDDCQIDWHALNPIPLELFKELELLHMSDIDLEEYSKDNDLSSASLKRSIVSIIDDNDLETDDILDVVCNVIVRYPNGYTEKYMPDSYEELSSLIFSIDNINFGMDDECSIDPIIIDDMSRDNAIFFINPDKVSVIEIPLLKLDEQLKREREELGLDISEDS